MSTTVVDAAFRSRLTQVIQSFGSVVALATAVGVSDNAIYKWLSGRGQPSVANLVALANAAKVSVEWLATGHEAVALKRSSVQNVELNGFAYFGGYNLKSPGLGREVLRSEQIVDYLAFKKEWVESRLNVEPRSLLLIEAIGDSMAPTLEDSDLLLVDLSEPRFRHDGMYVVRRDDELAVKRIQRRPDGAFNI